MSNRLYLAAQTYAVRRMKASANDGKSLGITGRSAKVFLAL